MLLTGIKGVGQKTPLDYFRREGLHCIPSFSVDIKDGQLDSDSAISGRMSVESIGHDVAQASSQRSHKIHLSWKSVEGVIKHFAFHQANRGHMKRTPTIAHF